jgi:hypothetical protein
MANVPETIERYGGDASAILRFGKDAPELLPYATLTNARASGLADFQAFYGVYEWQGRPLILLVDGDALGDDPDRVRRLRRAAAMRGDAPYLGIVRPGSLTVFQVALDDRTADAAQLDPPTAEDERLAFIPFLGNTRPEAARRNWISDVVLRLLTASIDALVGEGVSDGDAISLVGRALFVRFLADRAMLGPSVLPKGMSDTTILFDDAKSIIATSRWLDDTFNGDFLPLSSSVVRGLSKLALLRLGDILRRAPGGQLQLGWEEKWDRLDFAHIPVGVLSQAYELYLSKHDPEAQHREGGYYTPRHIADLMVRAAFAALEQEVRVDRARVLDPAAGAGVFLLTAFRQLVAERWRKRGRRPDTKELRSILYEQICGFDINESALRFAALGLYLISIELDPHPEPLQKLRFDNLRPKVLRKLFGARRDDKHTADDLGLGSLGPDVGDEHLRAYDLVIGNPPWAASTKLKGWRWLQTHVEHIARDRTGNATISAPLPNEVLDLPFVWRAMEWAKQNGQIAFALHARLLFQQGETMPQARAALFAALDVTGIINGTELRMTKVWPEITAPFCLLFARNQCPPPGAGFRFLSPRLEEGLNASGAWRIDAMNAERVTSEEVRSRPEFMKLLFRGSRLDLEIYDRMTDDRLPSLDQYWRQTFGVNRGKARDTGNGYQRLRESSEVQSGGDGLPGVSARYLRDLPLLDFDTFDALEIDIRRLAPFREARIHRRRPIEIFRGPLLIVKESPPVAHGRIRVSVAGHDVLYNQSFHGYSAVRHPQGAQLVRYLALVIASKLTLWRALITSGRFGFEREVVEKFILDSTPIIPLEQLKAADRKKIEPLFRRVAERDDEAAWADVDRWVGSLYGLSEADLRVIADTLRYNLPFAENRRLAQAPPSAAMREAFSEALLVELSGWSARFKRPLQARSIRAPTLSPWQFICVSAKGEETDTSVSLFHRGLERAADAMAATEIVIVDDRASLLWIGRLNHARYWSASQARLVARTLIWEHVDFLSGGKAA